MNHLLPPCTLFLILLVCIPSISASLTITPEQTSFDLIPGGTTTYNITLEYTDTFPTYINLSANIKPDGEGFTITFLSNPLYIEPNQKKTICMSITTSINIIPKPYEIEIIGYLEPPPQTILATGTRSEIEEESLTPPPLEPPSNNTINTIVPVATLPKSDFSIYYIIAIIGGLGLLLIYIMGRKKKHKEERK